MSKNLIWEQGNTSQENALNFQTISEWWSNLQGREITFAQRLIPENKDIEGINWDVQRFDEQGTLQNAQIRGITLYWSKLAEESEHNITPKRLELNIPENRLYIYPQSQSQVIIRVALPEEKYQLIELKNPEITATSLDKNAVFLFRDSQNKIEVTLNLTTEKQLYLLSQLAKMLKFNAKLNLSPDSLSQLLENFGK